MYEISKECEGVKLAMSDQHEFPPSIRSYNEYEYASKLTGKQETLQVLYTDEMSDELLFIRR